MPTLRPIWRPPLCTGPRDHCVPRRYQARPPGQDLLGPGSRESRPPCPLGHGRQRPERFLRLRDRSASRRRGRAAPPRSAPSTPPARFSRSRWRTRIPGRSAKVPRTAGGGAHQHRIRVLLAARPRRGAARQPGVFHTSNPKKSALESSSDHRRGTGRGTRRSAGRSTRAEMADGNRGLRDSTIGSIRDPRRTGDRRQCRGDRADLRGGRGDALDGPTARLVLVTDQSHQAHRAGLLAASGMEGRRPPRRGGRTLGRDRLWLFSTRAGRPPTPTRGSPSAKAWFSARIAGGCPPPGSTPGRVARPPGSRSALSGGGGA